jgi:hypothetical protein
MESQIGEGPENEIIVEGGKGKEILKYRAEGEQAFDMNMEEIERERKKELEKKKEGEYIISYFQESPLFLPTFLVVVAYHFCLIKRRKVLFKLHQWPTFDHCLKNRVSSNQAFYSTCFDH